MELQRSRGSMQACRRGGMKVWSAGVALKACCLKSSVGAPGDVMKSRYVTELWRRAADLGTWRRGGMEA